MNCPDRVDPMAVNGHKPLSPTWVIGHIYEVPHFGGGLSANRTILNRVVRFTEWFNAPSHSQIFEFQPAHLPSRNGVRCGPFPPADDSVAFAACGNAFPDPKEFP